MIKVIGFDLDNTLYNQELFEFEIFKQISIIVSKNFGINENQYFHELIKLYYNAEKEYLFDKAIMNINYKLPSLWEEFVISDILPTYRSFIPSNLNLYNNIKDDLQELKIKKYKLVLITNGNSNVQNNKIDVLHIRNYFDLILISDDYEPKRRKPDVFMFEQALNYFEIKSKEMLFIGDDLVRDKASELVGIKFIHINDFNITAIGE